MSGTFITFEGGEGSGKSTQMAWVAERLSAAGVPVVAVREPGDTALGEAVRRIVLDPATRVMDPRTELLLFEAARAELAARVIRPALDAGTVVLCDRHGDSSTAYQGYARGLDVETVRTLNALATNGLAPDRTLVFDIDPGVSLARAVANGADRIEAEAMAFHEAVRQGYLRIARDEPARVRVIDADGTVEEVAERTAAALRDVPEVARALGAGS